MDDNQYDEVCFFFYIFYRYIYICIYIERITNIYMQIYTQFGNYIGPDLDNKPNILSYDVSKRVNTYI